MSQSGNPFASLLRVAAVAVTAAIMGFFLAVFLCIMSMALYASIVRRDLDFTVAYRLAGPITAGVLFIAGGAYWTLREFRSSR